MGKFGEREKGKMREWNKWKNGRRWKRMLEMMRDYFIFPLMDLILFRITFVSG